MNAAQPEQTKKCPMCGEEILAVAVKCKHCKSMIAPLPAQDDRGTATGARRTGGVKRFVLAAVLMGAIAAVPSAFVNGVVGGAQDNDLARETGYGLTGSDVSELRRELGQERGCNTGGVLTYLVMWAAGTWFFGKKRSGRVG